MTDCINNYTPRTQRIGWIDMLRVFTMILVVMGHCTYYTIWTPYGGISYGMFEEKSFVFNSLSLLSGFFYSFHMPLFMAVSGACFSFSKKIDFAEMLKKKSHRLLLPFLLTTTFLAVPLKYISGYYIHSGNVFADILLGQYLLLGNTHLWFVVSLFYIFVAFHILESRLHMSKKIVGWFFLLILSWIGIWIKSRYFECFGLSGMLKFLFYFALGYSFFQVINRKNFSILHSMISWVVMFGAWIGYLKFMSVSADYPQTVRLLNYPIQTAFAIWGILNMAFTCKSLANCDKIKRTWLYRIFDKYTYQIYLYSDPFNYVLIVLLVMLLGNEIFMSNSGAIVAYLVRFCGTILLALLVIGIIHKFNSSRLKIRS